MASKSFADLKNYVKYLHGKTVRFPCPHCGNSILPKEYEKHCTSLHGLITRLCCAWCFGNVSWPHREKCLNTKHLFDCSRRFLDLNVPRTQIRTVQFDREPLCKKKDLFGRTRDSQPRAYEPVWPMPLSPSRLTYDIESLNMASSCVRMYVQLWKETYWAHVIVRAVAYQSFLEAMDADEGRTRTLPFSSWCDGGKDLEARHRQHLHVIVVAPSQKHFERKVWRKIKIAREDRPRGHFRIKHKDPIKNALHLVNSLGYVSQRKSLCKFSGDKIETDNHYYIFESLPKSFRLVLALQWKSGLLKLIQQEYHNLKLRDLVRAPMERVDGKWQIRVKDIPGIHFGMKLPVTADFSPCDYPTDTFLHLLHGKRLYFDRRHSSSQPDAVFYDIEGPEALTPRPYHQRIVNEFKPDVDRNRELEFENARLQDELAAGKAQLEASSSELASWKHKLAASSSQLASWREKHAATSSELASWREKHAHAELEARKGEHEAAEMQLVRAKGKQEVARLKRMHELEVAQLKAAYEQLKGKHESEVAQLKGEATQLKSAAEQLQEKINKLTDKVHQQNEAEIARLKAELAEARRRISLLENELADMKKERKLKKPKIL